MLAIVLCLLVGQTLADDPPKKKRQSLEDVYKKLDKNSDGKVTLEEFKAYPAIKNRQAAEKAFKAADADKNSWLSLDEFRDWAERMADRRAN